MNSTFARAVQSRDPSPDSHLKRTAEDARAVCCQAQRVQLQAELPSLASVSTISTWQEMKSSHCSSDVVGRSVLCLPFPHRSRFWQGLGSVHTRSAPAPGSYPLPSFLLASASAACTCSRSSGSLRIGQRRVRTARRCSLRASPQTPAPVVAPPSLCNLRRSSEWHLFRLPGQRA